MVRKKTEQKRCAHKTKKWSILYTWCFEMIFNGYSTSNHVTSSFTAEQRPTFWFIDFSEMLLQLSYVQPISKPGSPVDIHHLSLFDIGGCGIQSCTSPPARDCSFNLFSMGFNLGFSISFHTPGSKIMTLWSMLEYPCESEHGKPFSQFVAFEVRENDEIQRI